MANCGKHFPGHGWAEPIPTLRFLTTSASKTEHCWPHDAAPYRWLGPQLTGVMPAHVIYDAVDPAPAGFSSRWITMLREDLGFVGAAFTDDLLMEGASTQGTVLGAGGQRD